MKYRSLSLAGLALLVLFGCSDPGPEPDVGSDENLTAGGAEAKLGVIAESLFSHTEAWMGYTSEGFILSRNVEAVSWRVAICRTKTEEDFELVTFNRLGEVEQTTEELASLMPSAFRFTGEPTKTNLLLATVPGGIGVAEGGMKPDKPGWPVSHVKDKSTVMAVLVRPEFAELWTTISPPRTAESLFEMLPTQSRLAITADFSVVELPDELSLEDFKILLSVKADGQVPVKVLSNHRLY